MAERGTRLWVGVGDIHGRFRRVEEWLLALEQARGRQVELAFAVGDVEAFSDPEHHRRKAAKRGMPAEFASYADGTRTFPRPLYFIGGNNEDFAPLHAMQEGGELAPNVHYLGRAGVRTFGGATVAFLSGIYAPKHFETPLQEPRTVETSKQAGYFRFPELERFQGTTRPDLLLLHEWPKGVVRRTPNAPALRAYRFPWIGNPVARQLVEALRPRWAWCGHSHVPFAATLTHPGDEPTRVTCLDQAARPEGAIFWLEWEGGAPVRGGFGIEGTVSWEDGGAWGPAQVPATGPSDESAM